jgi:DNA polymerase-4
VTVTVRFENFTTLSRSRTTAAPMTTVEALAETAAALLAPFFDERENPRRRRIRLIGVRVEKLVRTEPPAAGGEPAGSGVAR